MVKARISRAAKKQTESEVKLENQEENQCEGLMNQFEDGDNGRCGRKGFDDHKIIKQFLMKRKLLMKALKLKQKEKNPKLLTLQAFQNNEGSPTSQQYTPSSHPSQDKSDTPSKQTSSVSSFTQEIQQNKIEVQEPYDQSDSKLNIGVQAKIISKRKYTKQNHSMRNNQEKYTVDYLIKDYENKERNKENGIRARRKRNAKDLQSIKNQINTLFSKDNENQFSSNSQSIQPSYDSIQDSQKQTSHYHEIISIMNGLNHQIQNYYDSKPLGKIIFAQFESKIHRRIKQKQSKKKTSGNLKSKRIKKHDKYSSFFMQTEEFQKKIQKKSYLSNKDQKTKLKKTKKSSARIINERFQILLTSKNSSKLDKNSQIGMSSKKNLSDDDSDQNNICEIFEDSESTEISFDPMEAWNTEFVNIQLMLLEKYDFLTAYMTTDKKVDYKRIIKNIRAEDKQNSDLFSMNNKTDSKSSSIQSSSDLSQLISLPKHNNLGKSHKRSAKPIQRKPLKQLQLEGQSSDESGKSFDFHQQFHSQTKPGQHLFIEDLNNSNVISRTLNLSFYSSTTGKKSDINFEGGDDNVNHLFLSPSESNFSDSNQLQHADNGPFPKVRVIQHEGLLFKGQKGKQYLYMSEEIQ